MSMELDEEHNLIRENAREFVKTEIVPIERKMDQENWYPRELLRKLGEMGFLGADVPEEYGGTGIDSLSYVIILEEISKVSPAVGIITEVQGSLVAGGIAQYGTEEQKEKYLEKLVSGEYVGSYALTEPGAGSDAAALSLSARKEGDSWVLNGTKTFITQGYVADLAIVFARTGDPKERHRTITAFIVEKGTKGFKVGSKLDVMGIRGTSTAELVFEDVEVPEENILGEFNKGFKIAMELLNIGRLCVAALSVGLAQGAYEESLRYATERKAFGVKLAQHQAISFYLADMITKINAARALTYNTAINRDKKKDIVLDAAIAKLFASRVAVEVSDLAVQIHGGLGFTKDSLVEKLYRDAKLMEIGEGTSEILKYVISKRILKGLL
ncbi:MAG: acyl-CoA dehydrogenase family protein [Candidatus Njordarchaeia archaeon]